MSAVFPARLALLVAHPEPDVPSPSAPIDPSSILLVHNLQHRFVAVETVRNKIVTPYFGSYAQRVVQERSEISFDHPVTLSPSQAQAEVAAPEVAAPEPRWSKLLQACGFSCIAAQEGQTAPIWRFALSSLAPKPIALSYFFVGKRYLSRHCLGRVSLSLRPDTVPTLSFTLTGLPDAIAPHPPEALAPSKTLALNEELSTPTNVAICLDDIELPVSALSLSISNQIDVIDYFQQRQVALTDRTVEGHLSCALSAQHGADIYQRCRAAERACLKMTLTYARGETFQLLAPYVQILAPEYTENSGTVDLTFAFTALAKSGDDELSLALSAPHRDVRRS